MTKITQIEDRGATTAWSPIGGSYADVIAVGAKDSGGIGFEDTGGELELYDLNMSGQQQQNPMLLGSVKTQSRFASLGWSAASNNYSMGLLAGGMENGNVNIWNPQGLIEQQGGGLIATMSQHASSGPVKSLQFNSLCPTQLATAGSDGKLLITNLDDNNNISTTTPSDDYQQHSQLTSVAWNTQVAHIVASAAADGTVAVWDLKSRKAWCELRSETAGQAVSDICWNPTQGLHLVTASADDRNPVVKLWDLRASTSMPLATLAGHRSGILSMAWCPHDDQLLVSCGKDNRTILWDLFTLQPICEVPNDIVTSTSNQQSQSMTQQPQQDIFAAAAAVNSSTSGLASSQQRRYDVQWSPIKRGVISTCSLDRKVQAHSVLGLATKSGRPPKWLRPSSSVSCGFGGTIVSCGKSNDPVISQQQQQQQQAPQQRRIVTISSVVEQPKLEQASRKFEEATQATNVIEFCKYRAGQATSKEDAQLWGFMQVIFETNARQQLLDHLGFDPTTIANAASTYSDDDVNAINGGVERMSMENGDQQEQVKSSGMTKAAMDMVQKALLVGNFEAAVECCFRTGNLADGLMLASCGGAELWSKTQQRYFELESSKRPFLSVVKSIIHSQLDDLVAKSDPTKWQETLAILSTYGKSEEFPSLCIKLGDLLEASGDAQNASLCYMCSLSLDRSVTYWRTQLEQASSSQESKTKSDGDLDLLALHEFVVKVSTFLQAAGSSATLDPKEADLFSKYAQKLAEQGLFVAAAKYSRYADTEENKILRDRLYRSRASPKCLAAMGGTPPEFPFSYDPTKQRRQPKQQQQQQQQQQTSSATQQQQPQQRQQQQQQSYNQSSTSASSYSQQQQHTTSNQSSVQASAAQTTTAPAADALPSGWMAIQDPASGRTYYANQTTGETTWDRPAPAPAPAPAAPTVQEQQPQQNSVSFSQQQQQSYASTNGTDTGSTPSRLASKYGDGFVTSASHPELASQYGNVGTSNPYSNTARPGTAAITTKNSEKAPVSGTLDPDRIPELAEEFHPIRDCLLSLITALKSTQLTAVDKRQLAEGEKGVAVLLKRLARGDISREVSSKVLSMTGMIVNHDFRSAQSVQTGLVNSDWREHKDWLKGIKALVQLAAKRF